MKNIDGFSHKLDRRVAQQLHQICRRLQRQSCQDPQRLSFAGQSDTGFFFRKCLATITTPAKAAMSNNQESHREPWGDVCSFEESEDIASI
jgi:hypothetical protein